jgi:hypothetical protein
VSRELHHSLHSSRFVYSPRHDVVSACLIFSLAHVRNADLCLPTLLALCDPFHRFGQSIVSMIQRDHSSQHKTCSPFSLIRHLRLASSFTTADFKRSLWHRPAIDRTRHDDRGKSRQQLSNRPDLDTQAERSIDDDQHHYRCHPGIIVQTRDQRSAYRSQRQETLSASSTRACQERIAKAEHQRPIRG